MPPRPKTSKAAFDWEVRQKHAAFYQTMISSIQQAAIAANAAMVIVLSLSVTLLKSVCATGSETLLLSAVVLVWLVLTLIITASHAASAKRVEAAYHDEHKTLFDDDRRYRLESFLFDFDKRMSWLVRGVGAKTTDEARTARAAGGGFGEGLR